MITSGANVFPGWSREAGSGKYERDAAKMRDENKPEKEFRLLQLMIDEPQITKEQYGIILKLKFWCLLAIENLIEKLIQNILEGNSRSEA